MYAYEQVRLHKESQLCLGAAGLHRALEVVNEGSLRASSGLSNLVTKLVLINRDAVEDSIVLPVTVEDIIGIEVIMVEGQLFQQLGSVPARTTKGDQSSGCLGYVGDLDLLVLTGLELADLDSLEVG